MCFYNFSGCKPQIAKDDIICYKSGYWIGQNFKSQYFDHVYPYGKQYHLDNFEVNTEGKTSLGEEGYHSFTEVRFIVRYDPKLIMVKCVIPKGSLFYSDGTTYFSDTIIVIEEIKPKENE